MPGATVLGTDGQVYMSTKIDGVYSWSRILNAERLVIGGDRDNFVVDLVSGGIIYKPAIAVEGLTDETSTISITRVGNEGPAISRLIMARSRGTTLGSDVPLQDADSVAVILFSASDGTSIIGGAGFTAVVDGTPEPGVTPMALLLRTREVGNNNIPQRVRISPNGNVLIGNTTGTEKLDVTGNIKASGALISSTLQTTGQVTSATPRQPVAIQLGTFERIPSLQVQGTTRSTTSLLVHSAGEITPLLATSRANGTLDVPLATVQGDALGGWNSYSFDGSDYTVSASLQAVAGTIAPGSTPGEWRFQTTATGNTSTTVRMILTSTGNLRIGNTTGTERLSVTGNIQLTNTADSFKVGTNNVVGSRKTGWAAPTGTATRTTFATSTVTTAQLAERLKALIDDLTSHGLIGPTPA
jgi:hypothetical protein